jgi:LuxR family maltose regulon positive regulatory protein
LNALDALSDDLALVLDDYHCITARLLHDALAFFLDHMPAHMHLIVSGRTHPPLLLARLRSHNELTELNEHDLRFTHEEASVFLRYIMGLALAEDMISALETRSEGWIAGLQLTALSLQGREDVADFITTFAGSHRHIFDTILFMH